MAAVSDSAITSRALDASPLVPGVALQQTHPTVAD